jgi:hypothetical protein
MVRSAAATKIAGCGVSVENTKTSALQKYLLGHHEEAIGPLHAWYFLVGHNPV